VHRPGFHAPILDIDHHCHLVESSTPGHYHLYIDVPITWEKYAVLLIALKVAGVLQEGYTDLSILRGSTHLRKPNVHKEPEDYPDS
jgi:hypothetical protein